MNHPQSYGTAHVGLQQNDREQEGHQPTNSRRYTTTQKKKKKKKQNKREKKQQTKLGKPKAVNNILNALAFVFAWIMYASFSLIL